MIDEQLNYLKRLQRFEKIKPGLQTMQSLMQALGNPQTKFASIHIAGTNGKGSTAAFLSSVLQQSHYHTGMYTSPHLCSFHERVVIDGQPIADTHLSQLIDLVRSAARQAKLTPTFFEFTTALAFLHFAAQKIDVAVIEVGMGGDLDATNIISPLLSIITNVSLDHTAWLGRTKLNIAKRKAGIIKPTVPLISGETNPVITSYFSRISAQQKSPFFHAPTALKTKCTENSLTGQTFNVSGLTNNTYRVSLLGSYQIDNARLAILAALLLRKHLPNINQTSIHSGLRQTTWAGRMQIVSHHPFILLDGAHNDAGFTSLADSLDTNLFPPPHTLILGVKSDTNPRLIIKKISSRFLRIILTEGNYDPLPVSRLLPLFKAHRYKIQTIVNPAQAFAYAQKTTPPDHLVLATGSLYMIGDILQTIKRHAYTLD